ncbi:hypothetical protein [Leptolyngbya sp. FACHB-261]|nr:hypothetical protein [Leptolyngbya sp. FACHB-261]MBD2100476.1 hypothetical protein [Leptolyngbya sp. FACHB-261]
MDGRVEAAIGKQEVEKLDCGEMALIGYWSNLLEVAERQEAVGATEAASV